APGGGFKIRGRGMAGMAGGEQSRSAVPAAAAPALGDFTKTKAAADGSAGENQERRIVSSDTYGDEHTAAPVVRSNFAYTGFWATRMVPDAHGTAEIEFTLPDSLTTWKIKAWTLGAGIRVGEGESELVATKDLLLRVQAPRFFVEKDEVVLSANVHNKLKEE